MVIGDELDFNKLTIIALLLIMVTDIDSEQIKWPSTEKYIR